MNKVVAIVQEILQQPPNNRYSISLYSNGGSVIRGVDENIANFGLVENGYTFQFSGSTVGFGYFEVWFKFEEGTTQ